MSFEVLVSDEAKKFLDKLPKEHRGIILKKLGNVRRNPYPHLKKLIGTAFWRLRVMDYRVIIDIVIKANTLYVVRIGHRKNVYDK
ncbi:MAG TPA: type II toxin-antitoxin system RelE/ParE family toxin [Acidobacteriota bacterium]|nr:type II toxin-antitoxin system RelE/ParE family toxin [Acidobacteriota bacterium]